MPRYATLVKAKLHLLSFVVDLVVQRAVQQQAAVNKSTANPHTLYKEYIHIKIEGRKQIHSILT